MRRLRFALPIALAVAAGLLLEAFLAAAESAFALGLVASVLAEEACKFLLLFLLALAGRLGIGPEGRETGAGGALQERRAERLRALRSGRMAGLGLVAMAIFAAAENLAYFSAFPGSDILGRLLWSEPVHLVSALAEGVAAVALARLAAPRRGRAPASASPATPPLRPCPARDLLESAFLPAFAVAWHLAFNLAADGALPGLLPGGALPPWAPAAAAAMNAAAIIVLVRYFVQRVIVGGFLYGDG